MNSLKGLCVRMIRPILGDFCVCAVCGSEVKHSRVTQCSKEHGNQAYVFPEKCKKHKDSIVPFVGVCGCCFREKELVCKCRMDATPVCKDCHDEFNGGMLGQPPCKRGFRCGKDIDEGGRA